MKFLRVISMVAFAGLAALGALSRAQTPTATESPAARGALPVAPGLAIAVYAPVLGPAGITFDPAGALFVGNLQANSRIRRVSIGGGLVETYGTTNLLNPEAVLFDGAGAIASTAGSVLVGGAASASTGVISAVRPNQTVQTVFGPSTTFRDPQDLSFDSTERLIFADGTAQVFATSGASPVLLFGLPAIPRRLAIGPSDRIYTSSEDGVVRIHQSNGALENGAFVTGLATAGPIGVGAGHPAWSGDLFVISAATQQLLRVRPDGAISIMGTGFDPSGHMRFAPDGAMYLSSPARNAILRVYPDCNANGTADDADIAGGTSVDCDDDGVPDECEEDCNANGKPDDCDILLSHNCCTARLEGGCNQPQIEACVCAVDHFCCTERWDETCVDEVLSLDCGECGTGGVSDCNVNLVPDECDISDATSQDCNGNELPDECDLESNHSNDCNSNGVPDECDPDCNSDGLPNQCAIAECDAEEPSCQDCNQNTVPDACDLSGGASLDCNGNRVPDECDLLTGSLDCNANNTPDECETPPTLLSADFASGMPTGWISTGLWHVTSECHEADTCAGATQWMYFGQDVFCNFDTGSPAVGFFRSASFVIPASVVSVSLSYCSSYDGEAGDSGFDLAFVTANGQTVDNVAVDGQRLAWETRTIDLAGFIGQTVSLEWHFDSVDDEDNLALGWQVTNIVVNNVGAGDCNINGRPDDCDIADGISVDCQGDAMPDECQVAGNDCNADTVPDDCEPDFDSDGLPDACDGDRDDDGVANAGDACDDTPPGAAVNSRGGPPADFDDDCDVDVDDFAVLAICLDLSGPQRPPPFAECGEVFDFDDDGDVDMRDVVRYQHLHSGPRCTAAAPLPDCNANGRADACDIAAFSSLDCNDDGVPDECEIIAGLADCQHDGVPDDCQVAGNDCNHNSVPDDCETDCNCNGTRDALDIAGGAARDCDHNGVPDSCQIAAGAADCQPDGIPDFCQLAAGDCNGNGVPDDCEADCNCNGIPDPFEPDCNHNDRPDGCDVAAGRSEDCNGNAVPDECENDCNCNLVPDHLDVLFGIADDCNGNSVPDECDVAAATSDDCQGDDVPDECQLGPNDCNGNGLPDDCEADCNCNGIPDAMDIAAGASEDCNTNLVPDECDVQGGASADCQGDAVPDECQLAGNNCNGNAIPDDCETDCNCNGVADAADLAAQTSPDCNGNLTPDECDVSGGASPDCQPDGVPDECQLAGNNCNGNAIPDDCETDCNCNGVPDAADISGGTSDDCNANLVPDECDLAGGTSTDCQSDAVPDECQLAGNNCNNNAIPDDCETDCNCNGIDDAADIASGDSSDCDFDGVPDECAGGLRGDCQPDGIPDECQLGGNDCNHNGVPDDCETDCNCNGLHDLIDISAGTSIDCDGNFIPDECQEGLLDCNANQVADECDDVTGFDWSADGDVDLEDYVGFRSCLAGPNRPPAPADAACVPLCLEAFDEGDGDVDLGDYVRMQRVFGQP